LIHNIIKVDGVEYQAVKIKKTLQNACQSCALEKCCAIGAPCLPWERGDKQDVIYKRRINIKDIGGEL